MKSSREVCGQAGPEGDPEVRSGRTPAVRRVRTLGTATLLLALLAAAPLAADPPAGPAAGPVPAPVPAAAPAPTPAVAPGPNPVAPPTPAPTAPTPSAATPTAATPAPAGPSAFEAQPAFGPEGAAVKDVPGGRAGAEGTNLGMYLTGVGTVLLLLAGAVGLARAWARRRGLVASSAIRPLGLRAIAPGASLVLVEVGRRVLRVGLHRQGMTYLGEVVDPEEVALVKSQCAATGVAAPESFTRTLDEAVRSYEGAPAAVQRRTELIDDIRSEIGRIQGSIRALGEPAEFPHAVQE